MSTELLPCTCGKDIRIRAMPVTFNRKRGVCHYLQHSDFTKLCIEGDWSAVMFKPYPKDENERPKVKMFDEWNKKALESNETG